MKSLFVSFIVVCVVSRGATKVVGNYCDTIVIRLGEVVSQVGKDENCIPCRRQPFNGSFETIVCKIFFCLILFIPSQFFGLVPIARPNCLLHDWDSTLGGYHE